MIVLKAAPLIRETTEILAAWTQSLPRRPTLSVILIDKHAPSQLYVQKKQIMAENLGFNVQLHRFETSVSEKQLLCVIHELNQDESIDGILIQLPVPEHLNAQKLIAALDPRKDVDGLHSVNQGLLWGNAPIEKYFTPCTPLGTVRLLNYYGIAVRQRSVLILGRSVLVGRPLAAMLLNCDAQVAVAHSRALASEQLIAQANIIIVATGSRRALSWEQLHEGQTLIDVGIHSLKTGKVCGDLGPRPDNACVATYSPVPGGVGPMTVNSLMYNIFKSYCLRWAPDSWVEFINENHRLFEPLYELTETSPGRYNV